MAPRGFTTSTNIGNRLIAEMIESVARGLTTETAQAFQKLAREIQNDGDLKKKLTSMHSELAASANQRLRTAYEGSGFNSTPYRQEDKGKNKRYPGAMGQAISKGYFYNVANDGAFVFLNEGKLRTFAPHWRRLNYGALPAPTKKVPVRPMRFGRGVGRASPGFKFALTDTKRSKAFKIPRGVWSSSFLAQTPSTPSDLAPPGGPGSGDAFYRMSSGYDRGRSGRSRLRTKGISGKGFIEQSLDYVNQEYPKKLKAVAEAHFRQDIKKSKPKGKGVG